MNFSGAYRLLNSGKKIKLPSWGGYWALEEGTIMMHLKDGSIMDMFDSDNKSYTLSNIASNEWIEADETNTPILGGIVTFDFKEAFNQMKKGHKVTRIEYIKGQTERGLVNIFTKESSDKVYIKFGEHSQEGIWCPLVDDLSATDWTFYHEQE